MKPSLYFKDCFRYFFKRFCRKESLFRWCLNQAGEDTGAFDFPAALKGNPKTLVFLPRDMEHSASFMHAMPDSFFKNTLLCAHESLHAIVSAKRAQVLYYSDLECRYGEPVFEEMERGVHVGPAVGAHAEGRKVKQVALLRRTEHLSFRRGVPGIYPAAEDLL